MTMETTTTKYEIKTYSEDVLESQFEIGTKEQARRVGWQMTPIDSLRQTYAGENFDPSTKFYAYNEDGMVGYITATIQPPADDGEVIARLEFPIVLEGHTNAKDQLMQHAITDLQNRGIKKVRSRVSKFWPGSLEFSEKYGYSYQSDISRRGILEISNRTMEPIPPEIKDIDLNDDTIIDRIVEFYVANYKAPEESIRGQFKQIKSNPDAIISLNYYESEGKILSVAALSRSPGDPKSAAFGAIQAFAENSQEIEDEMFNNQIFKAKNAGIENLNLILFGPQLEGQPKFEQLGFKFEPGLTMYEKTLDA